MGVANLFKLKPISRTRIIIFRRWTSSLSSVNTDNKDVNHELYRSGVQKLSTLFQKKKNSHLSASCLISSISLGRAPRPGSMCKGGSPSTDQSKCNEFAVSAEKINGSRSSCGSRNHSSDQDLRMVEVCKSSNKTSSATVDQSKCDEFAHSAENINDSGSFREAGNYSSEQAPMVVEVYKSSNKTSLTSTPSVSPGNRKRNTESIKDILIPAQSSSSSVSPYNRKRNTESIKDILIPAQSSSSSVSPDNRKRNTESIKDILIPAQSSSSSVSPGNRKKNTESIKDILIPAQSKTVVLEAASPTENVCNKLPEPVVIGEQPVPSKIIKNASRTIMIRGIDSQISIRDIRKVLALCGGDLSGISYGPSSFYAYVEFETEEDKEIALAKLPVRVMGKQMSILRIDTPKTTVVRVVYGAISGEKVSSICSSVGKVKQFNWRCPGIVDVHYCFTEWVKMVEILNSLNGRDVGCSQLLAQPATVYPPDILSHLWNLPEERKHIKKTVIDLLDKLRKKDAETVELTSLADRFYSNTVKGNLANRS